MAENQLLLGNCKNRHVVGSQIHESRSRHLDQGKLESSAAELNLAMTYAPTTGQEGFVVLRAQRLPGVEVSGSRYLTQKLVLELSSTIDPLPDLGR